MQYILVKELGLKLSSNFYSNNQTVMATLRVFDTDLEELQKQVEHVKQKLIAQDILEEKSRVIVEYVLFDDNLAYDKNW